MCNRKVSASRLRGSSSGSGVVSPLKTSTWYGRVSSFTVIITGESEMTHLAARPLRAKSSDLNHSAPTWLLSGAKLQVLLSSIFITASPCWRPFDLTLAYLTNARSPDVGRGRTLIKADIMHQVLWCRRVVLMCALVVLMTGVLAYTVVWWAACLAAQQVSARTASVFRRVGAASGLTFLCVTMSLTEAPRFVTVDAKSQSSLGSQEKLKPGRGLIKQEQVNKAINKQVLCVSC